MPFNPIAEEEDKSWVDYFKEVPLQDIVMDCEALHLPLVDGAIGGVMGGIPGFVLGLAIGIADEALLSSGFIAQPYLSAILLGGTVFESLFQEKIASYALGGSIGLAISLNGASFAEKYLSTAFQNALHVQGLQHLTGNLMPNGNFFVISSAALGVIEKLLEDDVWLSSILQSVIQAKMLFILKNRVTGVAPANEMSIVPTAGEGMLAIVFISCSYSDASQDIDVLALPQNPHELYSKMHVVLEDLLGEATLGKMIGRQSIIFIALPALAFRFNQYAAQYIQGFKAPFTRLGTQAIPESFEKAYQVGLWGLFTVLVMSPTESIARTLLMESQNRHLSEAIRDSLNDKVWADEMPMALANVTPLVSSMHANVDFFLEGRGLLLDSVDTKAQGIQAFLQLNRFHMLDFVVFLQMISEISEKISSVFASKQLEYHDDLQSVYADLSAWHSELTYKGKILVLKDQEALLGAENLQSVRALQNLVKWQNLYAVLERHWQQMVSAIYLIFNPGMIVYKAITTHQLSNANPLKPAPMLHAADQLTKAYGWRTRSTAQLIRFERGYRDLKRLIDYINHTEKNEPLSHTIEYYDALEIGIELEHFEILTCIQEKRVLYMDSLKIAKGIYALTGATGAGKSTLLNKLKGFQQDKFQSRGRIIFQYPLMKSLSIHYIPQDDYFPPKVNLFKQITGYDYNPSIHQGLKEQLLHLAEQLNLRALIENDLLKERIDWQKRLSGGQKKCIAVIGALLAKPQILLMDEVLNGMDAATIHKVQQLLKDHLPDALIINVDHEHHSHNTDGFYDAILNLSDTAITFNESA